MPPVASRLVHGCIRQHADVENVSGHIRGPAEVHARLQRQLHGRLDNAVLIEVRRLIRLVKGEDVVAQVAFGRTHGLLERLARLARPRDLLGRAREDEEGRVEGGCHDG